MREQSFELREDRFGRHLATFVSWTVLTGVTIKPNAAPTPPRTPEGFWAARAYPAPGRVCRLDQVGWEWRRLSGDADMIRTTGPRSAPAPAPTATTRAARPRRPPHAAPPARTARHR
ncbi:hypothetical protein E4K10_14740 [Streptomyces sp. T1317-0309]|nr:hypothetical protein E4K10_14740 [Streptomyces sp. T1317-0309]